MSDATRQLPDTFAVGDWIADRNALTVTRADDVRHLEPRAFAVLCYLCERPNRLVTIDELMDALWPDVVVTPNAVTRVVAQLRKALDDDSRHPDYVQTVARQGYRLVANVGAAPSYRHYVSRSVLAAMAAALLIVAAIAWFPRSDHAELASVAVLPFENFTGADELAYIGDGVAEEVIDRLAQIDNLRVAARSLSFRYPTADLDLQAFAQELDVQYVVEGSVRRAGRQLRVTAQLIVADDGRHLYSDTVEYDERELFAAQDAISTGVAMTLAEHVGASLPPAPASAPAAPDPEAYDLYLRGRYVWHRRGSEPMQPAVDAFAEAVKIDPEFARAWAALASAYVTYPQYSSRGYATYHLAEGAAEKALQLDADIPEAYAILGVFAEKRLQWIDAHAYFVEGIQRGERHATAHYWYGEHLMRTGRYRDALRQIRRAQAIDPTYEVPRVDEGFVYLAFGDHERGAAVFRDIWATGVRSPVPWVGLFISRVLLDDFAGARALIAESGLPAEQQEALQGFVDAEAGDAVLDEVADRLFGPDAAALEYRFLAWMGSRLGAYDKVFALFRDRVADGLNVDPRPLWGPDTLTIEQPGFRQLAAELDLIEYWTSVDWPDFCRPAAEGIDCDAESLRPADLAAIPGE